MAKKKLFGRVPFRLALVEAIFFIATKSLLVSSWKGIYLFAGHLDKAGKWQMHSGGLGIQ